MSLDERLFNEFWHLACHRTELLNPGDYIRFEALGKEVVLFNDAGNIVAYDNRCPHRGARMYHDDHGNQPATCKYHGWTYNNGKVLVPDGTSFSQCRMDDVAFNTYQVDWCGDFIFFGIAPKLALYDQLGDVATILENISFNIGERHHFDRYTYECYWPLAVENALEPYHIGMVHPNTLATLQLSDGKNEFDQLNSVWYAPVENTRVFKQLSKLKKFFQIDYQYEGYMSIYMFPFTMISSTFGFSYSLQNFFPGVGNTDQTQFTSRLLKSHIVSADAGTILESFFNSTAQVNRTVFKEDHDICKIMPRDSWSASRLKYPADSEAKIDHFRSSCRRVIEGGDTWPNNHH